MAKPFVNLQLENKVLRAVLPWDSNAENAEKNIKRALNLNYSIDIFDSTFRKWLWKTVLEQYQEKGELCGVQWVLNEIEKQYKTDEDVEKVKSIFRKVLESECEPEEFRPFLDELENLFNLRCLSQIHIRGLEELEKIDVGTKNTHSFDLLTQVREKLDSVSTGINQSRLIEAELLDSIDEFINELEDKRDNPWKYRGIPTGIEPLTEATDGWQPGELILVIGRPGKGKSIVVLNFGLAAYEANKNVILVTIEMPYEQQKRRGVSNITRVEYSDIKNPISLAKSDLERMRRQLKKFKETHENSFHLIDAPSNCTANYINARVDVWRKMTGKKPDLIIVDPLYLMRPNRIPADGDTVGAVSWDLKLLARNLSVPVIGTSQVNRSGQERHERGKRMDTTDSAFSDKTGQNADTMLGIKTDGIDLLMLDVIKYRDGIGPRLVLRREYNTMRISYVPELNQSNSTEHNETSRNEKKEEEGNRQDITKNKIGKSGKSGKTEKED